MDVRRTFGVLVALLASSLTARAEIEIVPEKLGGIYEINEPIRYTIRDTEGTPFTAHYEFKRGQIATIAQGDLVGNGSATLTIETKLDAPGTVLLEIKVKSGEQPERKLLRGAAVAPERIKPVAPAPADFDTFWASKIKELQSVPMNAAFEPAPPTTQPTTQPLPVDFYKITLDNIRGTKIRGQLARPQSGDKFPALLIVQWAGIYPLEKAWATDRAKDGWLTLNINPHDLPIDEPKEFYKAQNDGALKNYWAIGNDDRDASYFLRMYLSCYRAADYLASRPDWDGKTLVVMGTSQGGLQTLMIAGLHPKITAAIANVPAGCDFLGPEAGRNAGWPQWLSHGEGKDPQKVRTAAQYYDVVNFASRIKCPVYLSLGLIDQTCPPEGIFVAANQITSKKKVLVMVDSDHQGTNNTQKAFYETCYGNWLPALREGREPTPD
jgi:cephalosporin-C deacetylase-like acetyl esterase